MVCRVHKPRGSLLIELLLGMTLLTMAVLTVFALFPAGDRAVVSADRSTQAHQLARRLLEGEMAKSYDELAVGESDDIRTLEHSHRNGNPISTTFQVRTRITQVAGRELRSVTVEVRWERGSDEQNTAPPVVLTSLKGRVL